MTRVIIAEKPSQRKDLEAALGSSYGVFVNALGHLLVLESPEDVNPAWKAWTDEVVMPPSGRYAYKPSSGGGRSEALAKIRSALRGASEVVIATDCDREGQLIGESILSYLGWKGPTKRAMFTAQDPTTLKTAFARLEDNAKYRPLMAAGIARQQSDQIYNFTLTRVATNHLRAKYTDPVIGIGRVKTPTMGIVCRREIEIRSFRPEDYFEVAMTVAGASASATLMHAPGADERIKDAGIADAIRAAAAQFRGPVSVVTLRKKRKPPLPPDLSVLQKRASSAFGWPAQKTLDVAQSLYETHKIITYPRAECRHLPENMIPDAKRLLAELKSSRAYAAYPLKSPVIRKGGKEAWSDKGLAGVSHHAIIPNINCPGGVAAGAARLTGDDARLFDLIARAFLATIGEDHVYDSTAITALVAVPGQGDKQFRAQGSVTVDPGYTAIDGADEAAEDEAGAVAALTDGETVAATAAEVAAKKTEPPKRYNEGALIDAMKNAWRFIADPAERDRLKEASGIGTSATRAGIIEGLKSQNLLRQEGKHIVPTDAGLTLYGALLSAAPILLDPGATSRMEQLLDEVQAGRVDPDAVIARFAELAGRIIPAIVQAGAKTKIANAAAPARSFGSLPKSGASGGRASAKPAAAGKPAAPKKFGKKP